MSIEPVLPKPVSGPPLVGSTPAADPKGFDPSAIISIGVDLMGGFIVASENASAQRRLERRLAELSKQQQEDLAQRLREAQDQTARIALVYEYLLVAENQSSLNKLKNDRKKVLIVFGLGMAFLVILISIGKRDG